MVRPKWENLPADPGKQPRYIDRILDGCASRAVKSILETHDRQYDLQFRSVNYRADVDLTSVISKIAAAIQMRGIIAEELCDKCSREEGPFKGCIRIPSEQYGRCGNCVYSKASCSHGDASQGSRGSYVGYSVPPKTTELQGGPSKRARPNADRQDDTVESLDGLNRQTANSSDRYIILGHLILPRPPAERKEQAEIWERDLRKLDARDMNELRIPIRNLDDSFQEFQTREAATWQTVFQQNETPAHLVKPSGSLQSPLAHRLNQPSYTTDHPENGETADQTNGCIAMVMGNAYNQDTLLFDHVHRRDHTSEAIELYPAAMLECHEQFTNGIAQSMKAKVEIVYGMKVQQRLLQTQDFELLPLWGEFEGVILLLAYEKDYGNRDDRYRFRRVMLMAYHPQYLFYQSRNSDAALRQDKVMVAAARMVRNTVPVVEDYFSNKKWFACVPGPLVQREIRVLGRAIQNQRLRSQATIFKVDDDDDDVGESASKKGAWDIGFHKTPLSNNDLRMLIPPALDALNASQDSGDWNHPTDLPYSVLEWFLGQKHIFV